MIIKSLSRKSRNPRGSPGTLRTRRGRGHAGGSGAGGGIGSGGAGTAGTGGAGVKSPFRTLTAYMNRDIDSGDGRAVLWHNFYGDRDTPTEEIIERFELNGRLLPERKNGNVLYHEILSFERGYQLDEEALARIAADIGQEYLRERGADQLGYGVIHLDTDHCHLHLMISANRVDSPERVRLSKARFAEIQKAVERYTREHYPELKQRVIYDQDRGREPKEQGGPGGEGPGGSGTPSEKVITTNREQAMQVHRGQVSDKANLAQRMHQLFEQARSFDELTAALKKDNIRIYQRGKTLGLVVTEPDGSERKHRLATLGLMPHYEATNARLMQAMEQGRQREKQQRQQQGEKERTSAQTQGKDHAQAQAEREADRNTENQAHPPHESRETATRSQDRATDRAEPSKTYETVPPPPPSTQQTKRERLNEREQGNETMKPVVDKTLRTAETVAKTSSKAREIVAEEVRFGKEVLKDFIFSPYRDDRQPGHAKPPEPRVKKVARTERTDRTERTERKARVEPAREPIVPPKEKTAREAMMDELKNARAQGRGQEQDKSRDRGRDDDRER